MDDQQYREMEQLVKDFEVGVLNLCDLTCDVVCCFPVSVEWARQEDAALSHLQVMVGF